MNADVGVCKPFDHTKIIHIVILDPGLCFINKDSYGKDLRHREEPHGREDVDQDGYTNEVESAVYESFAVLWRQLADSKDLPLVKPVMPKEVEGES